ncbi:MAG: cell division protein SepF [Clostridia bacterium]|nr:cell division protein SepF [Clostridia bacterium]
MAKIPDAFKKYVSYSEGDYYDDADSLDYNYSQEEDYEEEAPAQQSRASSAPKKSIFDAFRSRASKVGSKRQNEIEYDDDYEYDDGDDYYDDQPQRTGSGGNVVDFSSKSKSGNAKVILAKPSMFDIETAKDIARHINKQRLVLLNLEQVNDPDVRRMIDFLSGVVFANDGKISCISNKTFIILPHNYDFSGDVLENLKNGYYTI